MDRFARATRRATAWWVCAVAVACGGSEGQVRQEPHELPGPPAERAGTAGAAEERPAGLPRDLITGPGTGPGLYLASAPEAPAIGYVSPEVPIRIATAPAQGRIKVLISGAMKVRGWMPVDRLAAYVQERGRIGGTPAYVGPNDLVRVVGPADRDGLLEVEVRPDLGRGETLGPYRGVYPTERLGATRAPASAEGPTPGDVFRLPTGTTVPVHDKPGQEVVATLPALDPPLTLVVLLDRGEWKGIRAGVGPYLVGFVNIALEDKISALMGESLGSASPATGSGSIPERLQADPDRPLWKLPRGTRIKFNGETVAMLEQDAFAREMNRYEDTGEADVFVAVNDRVAVRGMVPVPALQPLPGT